MMKKILGSSVIASAMALALPIVTHAQVVATGSLGINDWIDIVRRILAWAFPALITFAIAWLIVLVIKYIMTKNDDAAAGKLLAKKIGISIVALVAVLAIWGIMAFISSTLGLGIGGKINDDFIPGVEGFENLP